MSSITKAEMLLLDKFYVEECEEPDLEPFLQELRELVLGKTISQYKCLNFVSNLIT